MSPPEDNLVLFRRAPAGLRRSSLNAFARTLCSQVACGKTFHCLVTDDKELRRLNAQFLGKDYATDVLSFPEEQPGDRLGDIAISGHRAAEQAAEHGHGIEEEVRILMLHGLLHLLGMDHEKDRGRMRRAEISWRRKLGLPAGLIERVRP